MTTRPILAVDSWTDTRDTLHRWLQIVGKIRMVRTPHVNHWWNVTLHVTPRGLGAGPQVDGDCAERRRPSRGRRRQPSMAMLVVYS